MPVFTPGHLVRIKVTMGQLVITPIDESENDVTRHGILSIDPIIGFHRRITPQK
ncbi:hypothetical protein BLKGLAD_41790 [Burkholderia gladioli pv. gladioli]